MIVEPNKWQGRFIGLAQHIAMWSKDPSTKCGAVVVDHTKNVLGMGYNGFPAGCCDKPEMYQDREIKYSRIVHAEANALISALRHGHVRNAVMYIYPFAPCHECTKLIVQSRAIQQIVFPHLPPEDPRRCRWTDSHRIAQTMLRETGIEIMELKL